MPWVVGEGSPEKAGKELRFIPDISVIVPTYEAVWMGSYVTLGLGPQLEAMGPEGWVLWVRALPCVFVPSLLHVSAAV